MMAEAIDWDDSATVSEQAGPGDAWHVAVATDDVKVVSLEQLDDMFRLSIVDSETKVWQPGMSDWATLGQVAGLDEAPPQRAQPKPPSRRSSAAAPRRSLPPPPKRAPASAAPASLYNEPLRPVMAAAPLAPILSTAPVASVRPLVVSRPYPMPRQGSGFGRFIVGLAFVAGMAVTLYRNDVLRDAAHSIHEDALYAQLEQKLGGPPFGTLRAVKQGALDEAAAALTFSARASDASILHTASAATPSAMLARVAAAPTPNPIGTAPTSSVSQPPVVSLESLGREKGGAASAKPEVKARVAPVVAALRASAPSVARRPAPVVRTPASPPEPKAAKLALVEKPAPSAAPAKPEFARTPRERLNAEIAKSMLGAPASATKSKPASTGLKGSGEFDPLNPKL